jgi:hypothetical protein
MSAAADYPALAEYASTRGTDLETPEMQASWALDRIDRLEAELRIRNAEIQRLSVALIRQASYGGTSA